ncbi:LOW QUALITY PROTEIN: hypothetical protein ACHAXS_004992 [Conticribra weissflogii]
MLVLCMEILRCAHWYCNPDTLTTLLSLGIMPHMPDASASSQRPDHSLDIIQIKLCHVCNEEDEDEAHVAFEAEGLSIQYTCKQQYMGRFIGLNATWQEWLMPMLSKGRHPHTDPGHLLPQTMYVGMETSLQTKWQYICWVVPDIAKDLVLVKATIHYNFLHALFGSSMPISINDDFCHLQGHSNKMGGIGICNPTRIADCLFEASNCATSILIKNLIANADLSMEAHRSQVHQASPAMHHNCTRKQLSLRTSPQVTRASVTTSTQQRNLAHG